MLEWLTKLALCQTLTFSWLLPSNLNVKTEEEVLKLYEKVLEIDKKDLTVKEEKELQELIVEVKKASDNFTKSLTKEDIEKLTQKYEIEKEKLKKKVINKEPIGKEIQLCSTSSIKTYMDGSKITNRATQAYELITNMKISEDGFYKQGIYYAVALGNYYGPDGTKYRITLDTGKVFYAIKTDTKSDAHTYNKCTHISDGSMIEFIIDVPIATKYYGNVGLTGNFDAIDKFHGKVVKMELIED